MKVSYEFANGTASEVEVSEEVGTMIIDSRTAEESADRKERRHCWSLDAAFYEGAEYGTDDDPAEKLMQILDRECKGRKTGLGVAAFPYRKTSHVDVTDTAKVPGVTVVEGLPLLAETGKGRPEC